MKSIVHIAAVFFLLFFAATAHPLDNPDEPFTVDSTKGAKVNLYYYKRGSDSIEREKPVLLVHGFNSNGSVWSSEKNNYVQELTQYGYDVIVIDMRGNAVDTDGDHKVDAPAVGNSWGYGVNDLGDDVGTALIHGIDYLNKNLPGRSYKKADVVTHSTGALAVTSYSRSQGLVPYRDNIGTIIELAPPNNGSTSLVANIKETAQIIPSVFTQSMTAYEYALELLETKVWIPGGRMESENLRKELMPESLFLKSMEGLGPDLRIKTFIAVGDEDWVVGDWSPVIEGRDDVGYEYFVGLDHFNFYNSELVIKAVLDRLEKGDGSRFFKRYRPYRNGSLLSFLSGPGIDHPDDTFDVVSFAKNINISSRALFNLYLRIAARKNKTYLLKYWEGVVGFEEAQEDLDSGKDEQAVIKEREALLSEKNKIFHDNFINASTQYLECPDIAILANGYYNELTKLMIEKLGEPVRIIDHTFSPSILNEQKVLLIPSGGLSGLSNSAIFKKKLLEFVENGGTLICFSQQHGYDFSALPAGSLTGYGWQEDASCHSKACYIENFHQILSSQNEFYPDIKIDGYFTDYPSGAEILLRRTKNLMPAMLMYNFGEGIVIAATIYTDWAYSNGQASLSEIGLVRDMIRWSKSSSMLPEYKLGQDFNQTIDVRRDFNKIEMILKSQDNIVIERKMSTEPLYELSTILNKPGIYSVDYILYGPNSEIVQPQTEGFYFCNSSPPEGSMKNPDFTFDITSDSENYIQGTEALFAFHIKNNTNKNETIKCKAEFPHHGIKFTESIEAPAGTLISFDKKITAIKTDRLIANFYSSGNNFLGRTERGISVFEPSVEININTDRMQYAPGQKILIDPSVKNNSKASIELLLILNIVDSKYSEVYYNTKTLKLYGEENNAWKDVFKIPEDANRGAYKIKLDAFSNSKLVGSSSVYVDIPGPLLHRDDNLPSAFFDLLTIVMEKLVYRPGEPILAKVIINNKGEKIDSGILDIRVLPSVEIGDLWGVIRDDKGEAIKGALVNNVWTNSNGKYKIEQLKRGKHVLNITAPGYDKILKEIDILGGDNNLDVSLMTSRYGGLSGTLEGSIGSYLTLELIDVIGSDMCVRHAVVSKESTFEFKNVPVGTYRLNIEPEDIEKLINLSEGENIVLDSVLRASLEQYSSEEGKGLASALDMQEIEPNNDFDTAAEVGSDARVHGKIYNYGDEDFFKLSVASPCILNISLKNVAQGFRPHIKIYDSKRRWFDSTAASSGEDLEYSLEISNPGIYYLHLKDMYNAFSSSQEYILEVNLVQGMDRYEPNSDFNTAKEILTREEIAPTIFPKGDEDYFSINIKERGIFYIKMQKVPEGLRPSLKIYNSSGRLISQKGGASGEKVDLETEIEEPGQHYILIRDWYSNFSSLDAYSFRIYFIKTLDEYEPNNTKDEAYLIDFGKTYFATISTKGDNDFYKLSIPDSGRVAIYLNDIPLNIRPYIKLYRGSYAYWIDSKAGIGGENLVMEFEADNPSNYCIQVQDRYNSESSLLRYRLIAIYIPDNEYILEDPSIFTENMEISNLTHGKEIDVQIPGIKDIGKYYLQAALRSLRPEENAQVVERFYIGDLDVIPEPISVPEIAVSCLEDENTIFEAGEKARFRFKAINRGRSGGMCRIGFKFMDLFSHSVSEFLEPGSEKELQFEFQLPIDLEEGAYEAEYIFEDEKYAVNFKIRGLKVEVNSEFEDNIFRIAVQNKGSIKNVALFVEVRCGSFEDKEDFVLTDTQELAFNIPDTAAQEKIYYGIYFSSGKAIYLNSYLLSAEEELLPVPIKWVEAGCDKDSYAAGEAVSLTWKIDSDDRVTVKLAADLIFPDLNAIRVIDVGLDLDRGMNIVDRDISPEFMQEGLYRVLYRFIYEESVIVQGSIFFDVGEEEVKAELRIDKEEYIQDENIKLAVYCFSTFELKGDLVLFLDDKQAEESKNINLDGYKKFNFNIKASDVGQHRVHCTLFYDNKSIDSNKKGFNVLTKPKPNHSPLLFTIGEKKIITGETLEFFVEAMDIDGDLLFYSVDTMPDGASFDSNTRRFSWEPQHMQSGEYLVTFRVTDGKDSAFEIVKITVAEAASLPPRPKPLAEPLKGMAPLEVYFSADSVDDDGGIVKYEWDFDGKGVYDFDSLGSGDAWFIYTGKGVFPAALRVTDNEGSIDVYTVSIEVEGNPDAPGVFFEAAPLKGTAPCKVYFKASVTSLVDICKYEWDFNGDGIYDASSTESGDIVKTYTLPGKYNAEFRVTGSNGLAGSEKVLIEIDDPGVLSVELIIEGINPSGFQQDNSLKAGFQNQGNVPIEVGFDTSIDAKNKIQKYQWDFEGDGIFDFTSTSSAKTMYTYFKVGVYVPTLRITDEKNVSKESRKEVRFGVLHTDTIKKGKVIADPKKGKAPFTTHLSFDADFNLTGAEYFWDVDGDRSCDSVTFLPELEHVYYDAGVYIVEANVRVGNDLVSSCSNTIYVTDGKKGSVSTGVSESSELKKRKDVYKDKRGKIELSDRTYLLLPAGILDADDVVNIRKLENEEVFKEIALTDKENIIPAGEYREYKFESRSDPFGKEMTISIPYLDLDNNGFVDDKEIDELTLDAYWFDEESKDWKLVSDALVFPKENIITIKTNHFSIFGIAGLKRQSEDISSPEDSAGIGGSSGGGSAGCFIATTVFGTPMAKEVKMLYKFRDRYLLTSKIGRDLANLYYHYSPPVASFIKDRPLLKALLKYHLKLLVKLTQSIL